MQKQNLLILGAGQYGAVAKETAQAMDCFDRIDFLDDANPIALGTLSCCKTLRGSYDCAFVAIGDQQVRMHWLAELLQVGYELAVLIHPRAWVSPSARLMGGTIAEPMTVVHANAVVESGVLLCAGCVVNHNAHILSGCKIDCNAVVAARAAVPEKTYVPSGTCFERK